MATNKKSGGSSKTPNNKRSARSAKANAIARIVIGIAGILALVGISIVIGVAVRRARCEHTWNDGKVIVAATCEESGEIKYTCTKCGEKNTDSIPANGHDYTVYVEMVQATCTEEGHTDYVKCSVCGKAKVDPTVLPALGHMEEVDEAVQVTCLTDGLTRGVHCSRCGEVLEAQVVVPALGHSIVTQEAVAATCTTSGLTTGQYCSRCGEVYAAQEVIAALGHTDADADEKCDVCGVTMCIEHEAVTLAAVAATCTESGLTAGSVCGKCGEVLIAQEVIPAHGHDPIQLYCTDCGELSHPTTGYTLEKVVTGEGVDMDGGWYRFYKSGIREVQISVYGSNGGTILTWRSDDGKLLFSGTCENGCENAVAEIEFVETEEYIDIWIGGSYAGECTECGGLVSVQMSGDEEIYFLANGLSGTLYRLVGGV